MVYGSGMAPVELHSTLYFLRILCASVANYLLISHKKSPAMKRGFGSPVAVVRYQLACMPLMCWFRRLLWRAALLLWIRPLAGGETNV